MTTKDIKDTQEHLKESFNGLEIAFSDNKSQDVTKYLNEILIHLEALGYDRRETVYQLHIEAPTYERWKTGTGIKPETLIRLKKLVGGIISGNSQKAVIGSKTGFVPSRYVFEARQPFAQRIWYFASDRLLLSRSRVVRDEVLNIFSVSEQEQIINGKERPHHPVLIYVYPVHSETEASLNEWEASLQLLSRDNNRRLRGTVLGLSLTEPSFLPWFVPGIRMVILEIDGEREAYIRVRIPDEAQEGLLLALESDSGEPQVPWLRVHNDVAERWYTKCEERIIPFINEKYQSFNSEEFYVDIFPWPVQSSNSSRTTIPSANDLVTSR